MPLNGILAALAQHSGFTQHFAQIGLNLKNEHKNGYQPAEIAVRLGARPAYLAALWQKFQKPLLVLSPRPEDARRLHDQLLTYLGESSPVYLLPESEVLPFERLAVDSRTSNERLEALSVLARAGHDCPEESRVASPLIIASLSAALRRTLPPNLAGNLASPSGGGTGLKVGQRIPKLDDLLSGWVDLGYRHEPLVEAPGCFSQRGGIIDVFSPHSEHFGVPIRTRGSPPQQYGVTLVLQPHLWRGISPSS